MKFTTEKYTTKSNRVIKIRMVTEGEAQALIDLKKNYIKGATTIPILWQEFKTTEAEERALIKKYNDSANGILLVASCGDELIGNIDLTGSEREIMKHTAMVGMGIKENWRNQGVGTYLMESAMNWAKEKSALEIIWLDVYASNELGLGLYKKMNFQISGEIKNFFKYGDEYFHKIQMWCKMK